MFGGLLGQGTDPFWWPAAPQPPGAAHGARVRAGLRDAGGKSWSEGCPSPALLPRPPSPVGPGETSPNRGKERDPGQQVGQGPWGASQHPPPPRPPPPLPPPHPMAPPVSTADPQSPRRRAGWRPWDLFFLSCLKEEGKELSVLQTNFCPGKFLFSPQKRSPTGSSHLGHAKAPFEALTGKNREEKKRKLCFK